eukprot:1148805-Pelagomonas_calceolata.AAC.5
MNATHDAFCGVNAFQGCRWVIAADWTPCAYALPDPNGFQFFSFPRNSEILHGSHRVLPLFNQALDSMCCCHALLASSEKERKGKGRLHKPSSPVH